MEVIAIAGSVVGATGFAFGFLFGHRLWQWEKQLRQARLAVFYKNRSKMQVPLVEVLGWANMLEKDERSKGRAFYKMGATTIAILKPAVAPKAKTTTRTVKEKSTA